MVRTLRSICEKPLRFCRIGDCMRVCAQFLSAHVRVGVCVCVCVHVCAAVMFCGLFTRLVVLLRRRLFVHLFFVHLFACWLVCVCLVPLVLACFFRHPDDAFADNGFYLLFFGGPHRLLFVCLFRFVCFAALRFTSLRLFVCSLVRSLARLFVRSFVWVCVCVFVCLLCLFCLLVWLTGGLVWFGLVGSVLVWYVCLFVGLVCLFVSFRFCFVFVCLFVCLCVVVLLCVCAAVCVYDGLVCVVVCVWSPACLCACLLASLFVALCTHCA